MNEIAEQGIRGLILVADDSATCRRRLEIFLRRNGYAVTTVDDGVQALEELRHNLPDIAVIDESMPGMDGGEFVTKIRRSEDESVRFLPIFLMVDRKMFDYKQADVNSALWCGGLGAHAYLDKPVDLKELLKLIQVTLRRRTERYGEHRAARR